MVEVGASCCPFRAEVVAAVPLRLSMLVHGLGLLAMLLLRP